MNCTNCGQALTPGAQFCGNCGAQTVQSAAPAQPTQQPMAPAPAQVQAPIAPAPMPAAPVATQQPVAPAPAPVQPGQPMQPMQQPMNYQMPPGQPMPNGPMMPDAGVGPSALKNIKIFGWLGVVIGAINMVFGPVMIKLLVSSAEEAGGVADDDKVAVAMAIAAISGLIVLGIGAMALKNKNNPQAVKPYLIAGIVATVLTFVISIADGSTPPILFLIFGAYAGVALNSLKTGQ